MNVVILRCRNCDEANKKIYIKQICGASTCRMTMIRRALDSPMSKDLPRYLERCRRPHRKFSSVVWKKSSSSKHEVLSEYSSLTLSFIFQNLNFFHISWHIIWWMCRAFTICLLTQRTRLSGPSRYLRCVRKAYGKAISPQKATYNSKILRNDWKSVSKQKSFTQGWDWFRVEVSNCK